MYIIDMYLRYLEVLNVFDTLLSASPEALVLRKALVQPQ